MTDILPIANPNGAGVGRRWTRARDFHNQRFALNVVRWFARDL